MGSSSEDQNLNGPSAETNPDEDTEEKLDDTQKDPLLTEALKKVKDYADKTENSSTWQQRAIRRVTGIGVAPINIPTSRRLETSSVLLWMSSFLFMGFGMLFFLIYLFFYTQFWWFSLAYFTWFLGDWSICNRGGRRSEFVKSLPLWNHFRNFFPVKVIKLAELDPKKNYLMCYHPHGILCAAAFSFFAGSTEYFHSIFPGMKPFLCTLQGQFFLPIYRELLLACGAVSAKRESLNYTLGSEERGHAVCLVPGGAREPIECHPGTATLYLKTRMGFCKMALRHGSDLVPMYGFGENDVYDQVSNPEGSWLRKAQLYFLRVWGIPTCLILGRGIFQYSFGIVPYRRPIFLVIGKPIEVKQIQYPTSEDIEGLHAKYVEELTKLYDTYKHKYSSSPEVPLTLI